MMANIIGPRRASLSAFFPIIAGIIVGSGGHVRRPALRRVNRAFTGAA
jgi:hypothetical protein